MGYICAQSEYTVEKRTENVCGLTVRSFKWWSDFRSDCVWFFSAGIENFLWSLISAWGFNGSRIQKYGRNGSTQCGRGADNYQATYIDK